MPVATAVSLRRSRDRPAGVDAGDDDIHERNVTYLHEVHVRYQWLAQHLPHWVTIGCERDGALRPRADIAEEVLADARALLGAR
jgi:hypothetical protein